MSEVLVIDDDRSVGEMLRHGLTAADITVDVAMTAEDGLARLANQPADAVLLDVMLPGISGLDLFEQIKKIDRRLPVIFMTSGVDTATTIRAMQLGGFDYVVKPLDIPSLTSIVDEAISTHRMMKTPVALAVDANHPGDAEAFIARSPAMLDVLKSIGRVAAQNVTVLVLGESGTGKELVARALYQNSHRSTESFFAVNCAALPDALLESELFGHEKGAFTGADRQRIGKFEACNGGTIFLDEVGDMSPAVQGKVLRLLQQQEFQRVGGNVTIRTDVRIIAATNLDLSQMVKDGEFREDLFYRLNGVTINLPPLRERGDDLIALLEYFLRLVANQMHREDIEGISPEALEMLLRYSWPGNVRQLHSVVRQAVLNATGPVIVPAFLPPETRESALVAPTDHSAVPSNGQDSEFAKFISNRVALNSTDLYAESLEYMERRLFRQVLQLTEGNQSKAAEILGITRGKIRDRIRQFGIVVDKRISLDEEE